MMEFVLETERHKINTDVKNLTWMYLGRFSNENIIN